MGVVIDVGVLVAMFAAVLGCVMAAARVAMLMAHAGLLHARLRKTNARHGTPMAASLLAAVLAFLPPAALAMRGVSGADVYGYMGTLAVFGFLTAYLLVVLAMVVYLRRRARLTAGKIVLAAAAIVAMLGAVVGSVYPVPAGAYRALPYVYLAYLLCGLGWYAAVRGRLRA